MSASRKANQTALQLHKPNEALDPNVPNPNKEFLVVPYAQPHSERRKLLEQLHPEVKQLYGPYPPSALFTFGIVGLMFVSAYLIRDQPWWVIVTAAWMGGAFVAHSLWVLIHECAHNLVFKSDTWNNIFLLVNNLPHLIPASVTFAHFHRLHHGKLNDAYADPDIPTWIEAKLFGTTFFGKLIWLVFLAFFQCLRPLRFGSSFVKNKWLWLNIATQLVVSALVWQYMGSGAFMFLLLSNLFCLGPHVYGGRWIAEHYSMFPFQETYSYYGYLNWISFNIGYHNEHHDLVNVAWIKLPLVKKAAPEFYDHLVTHTSYWAVLKEFLFNPNFTLETRVVRKMKRQ